MTAEEWLAGECAARFWEWLGDRMAPDHDFRYIATRFIAKLQEEIAQLRDQLAERK